MKKVVIILAIVFATNTIFTSCKSDKKEVKKEQEVLEVDETKKPWYEPGLPVFQWLFSCFWCASILLLAALYLVTKIIFKILRMF